MDGFVPLQGFEGVYEIAPDGCIRSVSRTVTRRNGVVQTVKGQPIQCQIDARGELTVRLNRGPGLGASTRLVATLVARHFVPNPSALPCIKPRDGNALNVDANNLIWASVGDARRKPLGSKVCQFCSKSFDPTWHAQRFCSVDHAFESKIHKPSSGSSMTCWTWRGLLASNGYGIFPTKQRSPDGQSISRNVIAHRKSFEIHCGPIPDGMSVLHRCDTPACVRPDHLFLGTQTDNMRDCAVKGRVRHQDHKGEGNNRARLTEQQVREVRSDGRQPDQVAAKYGITIGHVHQIRRRRSWAHIP